MIKVVSVNISDVRGVRKSPVEEAVFKAGFGIVGDGHASRETHKQISLVGLESYKKLEKEEGLKLNPGSFAENITTSGIILYELLIGTLLQIGEVVLEITRIGKKKHSVPFRTLLPTEGIFATVIKSGTIKKGDSIKII
jgi:MOSC domain-containing protein YiiM